MSRRFSKILIANRGEIACRIMRTASELGYKTVAVYSDADANAPHVEDADEAVHIGASPPSESYLDMNKILDAAKRTGADAIHPGYGFLSENADFAQACADNGITFIGPSPEAIAAMGNKAEAKRLMLKAGVPCVPGYEGEDQSDAVLKSEADKIGYPVLLKAAAGGGGRGMRRVNTPKDFQEALTSARSESKKAFGSDEMIIEKLVENARHVEIQVFGDEHGTIIHLGERDCSVQRRHQKVIEEAPCPVMTPELREKMGTAAINAAKTVNYTNAGTVEFMLDAEFNFYFLEMNTRLQVEHPVTEEVYGVDLVEAQLAVAQGDTLDSVIEVSEPVGHAIELRIYAEDPSNNFQPQTGKILDCSCGIRLRNVRCRVDSGIEPGYIVSPNYDPMLAKIIVHGDNREHARTSMLEALDEFELFGVKSNIDFLRSILQHETFIEGNATTSFLENSSLLTDQSTAISVNTLLLAAVVFIERDSAQVPATLKGWRSTGITTIPLKLTCEGKEFALNVGMSGKRFELTHGEQSCAIRIEEGLMQETFAGSNSGFIYYAIEGNKHEATLVFDENVLWLKVDGSTHRFEDLTYAPPVLDDAAGDGSVKAPMIGALVRINVSAGDRVAKGDVLLILEAMKMENQVVAPCDGTVETIHAAEGDQVEANRLLITIQPDPTEDE